MDPWREFNPKDATRYPYSKPARILRQYADPRGRSLPLLLASLSHFGEICLRNRPMISPPLDTVQVAAVASLCTGTTSPDHFDVLFADDISNLNTENSIPILPASVLPNSVSEKLHPELSKRRDTNNLVFYQHLRDNNWVILFANLNSTLPTIDGYFVGHAIPSDLDPIVDRLTKLLWTRGLGKTRVIWTRRVFVLGPFSADNTFLTYTLVLLLQRKYQYLDLTMDLMTQFKFRVTKLRELLNSHDQWLGELKIQELTSSLLPFISDAFKAKDKLQDLYRLGWTVQDVLGDGNCGFYALLLGLLNIGILDFDVNKDNWKQIVYKFRHSLRAHSRLILQSIYPPNAWKSLTLAWLVAQAVQEKDVERLSESLAPTSYRKPEDYFTARLKKNTEYHMNPGWASHVLASKYQIRVIVYLMVMKGEKCSWSIQTFEYANERHVSTEAPHVKVDQQYDIPSIDELEAARISDLEFKRIPTIEILFQTGNEKNSTQHFQYLQRSVCSGVREPPPCSQITLGEFLVHQQNAQRPLEPTDKIPNSTGELMDLFLLEDLMDLDSRIDDDVTGNMQDVSVAFPPLDAINETTRITSKESKRLDLHDVLEGSGPSDAIQKTPRGIAKGTKRSIKTPLQNTKKPAIRVAAYFNDRLSREVVIPTHVNAPEGLIMGAVPTVPTGVNAVPTIRTNGSAPVELLTEVVSTYQQDDQSFSLCYPVANVLDHAEYPEEALKMYLEATRLASYQSEEQIGQLSHAMQTIIPVIASPTIYNQRLTSGNRKKRILTWESLFNERTPYPTVIIPGVHEHAFCVIDDLIFDSTTPRALKLCMDSVRWLCRGQEPTIQCAYRFETKYSAPGTSKKYKTKGEYKHNLKEHWKHE